MAKKFPIINYIDLFAGPGKCRVKGARELTDGSPLIASRFSFSSYFLVDMNPDAIDALQNRFPHGDRAVFYQDDCNRCVEDIRRRISDYALNLLVADQTNVQLKFETLKILTAGRRVDMILYFPTGVYFKRAVPTLKDAEKIQSINDFFGDRGEGLEIWRTSAPSSQNAAVVSYYKGRLRTLGYQFDDKVDRDKPILNEDKKVELYRLIFASKHSLGSKFWREIQKIDHRGQRELPLR